MPEKPSIVLHLGAITTQTDELLWSVRKDGALLPKYGVAAPHPKRYQKVLFDLAARLRGSAPGPGEKAEIQNAVFGDLAPEAVRRLVLGNELFLGYPKSVISNAGLYPKAGAKSNWLRALFPDYPCAFSIALRNPATLIPDLTQGASGYAEIMNGVNLMQLRWTDVIERISEANPGHPLIVWCHEDAPIIWHRVIRTLAAVSDDTPLTQSTRFVDALLTGEGRDALARHLKDHPQLKPDEMTEVFGTFLQNHATEDALEAEIDLPGWTDETVAALTAQYEDDIHAIAGFDNVRLIEP